MLIMANAFSAAEESTEKKRPYSINLVWINQNLDEGQEFIYRRKKAELQDPVVNFFAPILGWAEQNTEKGAVTVWYDSGVTTPAAVTRSEQYIRAQVNTRSTDYAPIYFRDIRELSYFKSLKAGPSVEINSLFEGEIGQTPYDKLPTFFKVDISRPIIQVDTFKNSQGGYEEPGIEHKIYYAFADFDMPPLSIETLLVDQSEAKEALDRFGIVMSRGGHLGFENGFQIITADPCLLEALQKALVVPVLRHTADHYREGTTRCLQQIIYDIYPGVAIYLYALKKVGALAVELGEIVLWEKYLSSECSEVADLDNHQRLWAAFGRCFSSGCSETPSAILLDQKRIPMNRNSHPGWFTKRVLSKQLGLLPTISVSLPPAKLDYED